MFDNPVLIKELKTKMRSRQSRQVQLTTVCILGIFILWCYYEAIGYLLRDNSTDTARSAWGVAVGFQAVLIWLLAPSLTANAISQEKEQQTWEMLVFTRLTPVEILIGKLISRLLPLVALLAAFTPFMLFCLWRGNIGFSEFLLTYLHFAVWSLFMTTVGLFMSWAFRRTAAAIATSYLILFVLTIGTALIESILTPGYGNTPTPVLWLNPAYITSALLEGNVPNPASVQTFSLVVFVGITLFLFWRMVYRFRVFSTE